VRAPRDGYKAWDPLDVLALKWAFEALEHPGIFIRITDWLGRPIERGIEHLPKRIQSKIQVATQAALQRALKLALTTLRGSPPKSPRLSRNLQKAAVAGTGGVGGFFGFAALAIELPLTTTIMLRSITDIARAEGEDVRSLNTQLACLEVFAFGGRKRGDDAAETTYFEVRAALAVAVAKGAEYLSTKGAVAEGAPIIVKFIRLVAQRFSVQVTERVAAKAIPIIGAVGGAAINCIFIEHFQSMARGHFIVRRLERRYGPAAVRSAYEALRSGGQAS
jgi:hypothetical protein